MEPLLVGKKDAAALLGVSLRKLDYLIEQGKLQPRRIGRRVLLAYAGLRKFAGEGSISQKAKAVDACSGEVEVSRE